MTQEQALIIASWRMHFEASFSLIGGLACAVFGPRAASLCGSEHPCGAGLGRDLVNAMEATLGIPRAESDNMTMNEQICMSCHHIQWSIGYKADTPFECAECGKMEAVFANAGLDRQEEAR